MSDCDASGYTMATMCAFVLLAVIGSATFAFLLGVAVGRLRYAVEVGCRRSDAKNETKNMPLKNETKAVVFTKEDCRRILDSFAWHVFFAMVVGDFTRPLFKIFFGFPGLVTHDGIVENILLKATKDGTIVLERLLRDPLGNDPVFVGDDGTHKLCLIMDMIIRAHPGVLTSPQWEQLVEKAFHDAFPVAINVLILKKQHGN